MYRIPKNKKRPKPMAYSASWLNPYFHHFNCWFECTYLEDAFQPVLNGLSNYFMLNLPHDLSPIHDGISDTSPRRTLRH